MPYQSGFPLAAFDELCAFVAVVDAHGFSAAARATGGRKATFSRRVQELEARLGVSLLARSTRALRLTDEGRAYYEHAKRAISAARDADAVVLAAKAEPRGLLRVTASASLAQGVLDHVVTRYLTQYPQVSVQLDGSDARVDLLREGFDLAIRVGALADSSLIARSLGRMRGGYFASPAYLKRRGKPRTPSDLDGHDTIVIPKGDGPAEWVFAIRGKKTAVRVRPRLVVTSVELGVRAAAAGLGIVRAPVALVEPLLATRALVSVFDAATLLGPEVHAVFPPGGTLVPKTRTFVDMLDRWFSAREAPAPGDRVTPARTRRV